MSSLSRHVPITAPRYYILSASASLASPSLSLTGFHSRWPDLLRQTGFVRPSLFHFHGGCFAEPPLLLPEVLPFQKVSLHSHSRPDPVPVLYLFPAFSQTRQ